jgi:hypothetical protein
MNSLSDVRHILLNAFINLFLTAADASYLGHRSNSHDACRYKYVSLIILGILMFGHVSKSARCLAIASCFAGISGCASDGGLGELAAMGALVGGSAVGMDTGTMIAVATVATGALVVASASSDAPATGASTAPAIPISTNGTPTAVASTTVVAPPTSQGKLGVEVETLSTSMGTAVGLKPAEGALVIATTKGSTGDKGGLKALDVIVEVSGQAVTDTASLQAIVGNMRTGYKAPVRVWREHAFKDLTVEVTARSEASSTVSAPTASASAVATPPAAKIPIAEPVKPVQTRNFCLAYLAIENTYGAVVSPIQEKHDYDGSSSAMLASLKSYIAKVKQVQPGVWGEFDNGVISCESDTYNCMAQTKGGLFTKKQTAGQFCHYTRAEAELELADMHKGDPSSQTVAWP